MTTAETEKIRPGTLPEGITPQQCILQMTWYYDRLLYLVRNKSNIVLAGEYALPGIDTINSQQFPILQLPYQHVYAAVSNRYYHLVPSHLHSKEFNAEYLNFSFEDRSFENFTAGNDALRGLQAVLVYYIPDQIKNLLKFKFQNLIIRHEKSTVAEQARALAEEIGDLILVNFCVNHFDIFICKKGKTLFFNSFPMNNTEEILYYIFDVLKQLDLSVQDFQLRMCGLNPSFMNTELMFRFLPSLRNKIIPDNLPNALPEPATYFTTYFLDR